MSKKNKVSKKRTSSKRGRTEGRMPLLLTDPSVKDRLCRFVRMGLSLKDAALLADVVTPGRVYEWMEKAKGPTNAPCYLDFSNAVEKARAEARARFLMCINKAVLHEEVHHTDATCPNCQHEHRVTTVVQMPGDARAAAAALTRSDPENYPSERMVSELRLTGAPGTMAQLQVYVPRREFPALPDTNDDGR